MLDLSTEIDPDNLDDLTGIPGDGSFEGLILQELGIFIGDPNEVGTWSGMTRVHNFVLRFDPVEVTGTFEGERPCSCPRRPASRYRRQLGDRLRAARNVDEVDPTIPAPVAPETAQGAVGRHSQLGVGGIQGYLDGPGDRPGDGSGRGTRTDQPT